MSFKCKHFYPWAVNGVLSSPHRAGRTREFVNVITWKRGDVGVSDWNHRCICLEAEGQHWPSQQDLKNWWSFTVGFFGGWLTRFVVCVECDVPGRFPCQLCVCETKWQEKHTAVHEVGVLLADQKPRGHHCHRRDQLCIRQVCADKTVD